MQLTWTGAPTIYYGDEAGVVGFTDPDNRRTYPWGHEDRELISFHKEMIRIHKEREEFVHGSLRKMAGEYMVIGYGRFTRNNASVVLVNRDSVERTVTVYLRDLIQTGDLELERIMETSENGFDTEVVDVPMESVKLTYTLKPVSAVVISSKRKQPKSIEETDDAEVSNFAPGCEE